MPSATTLIPKGYDNFLAELKDRIHHAQLRAGLAVNQELVLLYWSIGRDILARQNKKGWGAKVIDRLAADLRKAFPDMSGFSPRNLKYMRAFAEAWPEEAIVQATLAQITWYHNLALIEKINTTDERLWYARQTVENGWSRNVLVYQIESGLYRRQGRALTNFTRTLPAPQSELAQQIVKDPYNFEFLSLSQEAQERELERGLLDHIRDFLLELGVGFAFVGSQYPLQVGGEEFRIDLLFYHLKLRAYVILDLKMEGFKPEFSGKMNFYLSAADDLLRHPSDQPSIGIILCKSKNKIVAEYALRDLRKPMSVSEYRITECLPKQLKGSLPTVQELEAELKGANAPDDLNEK
ncbi:MAG TPA: PDDEXK nuclease domain-containing protein [Terriglobia bacterium]|nr:PDDEXK nuclease domain-containing protein [Terriglobia bacterium]